MKKLFTINKTGFFWIEKENESYSLYDLKTHQTTYYDYSGQKIENYEILNEEEDEMSISFDCEDENIPIYNQYGVAEGDDSLIDLEGKPIPDTQLNLVDEGYETSRYFMFTLLNEEQLESIARCGTAPGITMDVYDTKLRKYVVKGIPECKLSLMEFDGENEVVVAATELLDEYDSVYIDGQGTIVAKKENGDVTVYDYYQ